MVPIDRTIRFSLFMVFKKGSGLGPDWTVASLNLRKAESLVLVQFRTRRVELAYFLNKAQVPEYDIGLYHCGQAKETP
jgi:hypothetical protein